MSEIGLIRKRAELLLANQFDAALDVGDPQLDWSDAYASDVPLLLKEHDRLLGVLLHVELKIARAMRGGASRLTPSGKERGE